MKRILLIMMLLLIPQSLSDPDPAYDGLYTVAGVPWVGDLGKEDVIIEHWYPIEDWEIEVCSKWGGTAEASSNAAGGAVATGSTNLALTTLTLQGQKTYIADDETLRHAKFYIDNASESEVVDTLKKITSRSCYNKGAAGVHVHQFWSQHMQVTGMSKDPKVYFEVSRR